MASRISDRMVKNFERFDKDLISFGIETGETDVTLYEDAYTTRQVRDFRLCKNGKLTWVEDGVRESEQMLDDDDAKDWLSFWRANLRRARKYWSMDCETLDRIHDGEMRDIEVEE